MTSVEDECGESDFRTPLRRQLRNLSLASPLLLLLFVLLLIIGWIVVRRPFPGDLFDSLIPLMRWLVGIGMGFLVGIVCHFTLLGYLEHFYRTYLVPSDSQMVGSQAW